MSDTPIPSVPLRGPIDLRPAADPAGERAQVATLAQEFEAMLMLQMVRQMRQSMLDESEQDGGLGRSTMTDTFDVEFSRALARAGGVGFATFMVNALDAQRASPSTSAAADGTEVHDIARSSTSHEAQNVTLETGARRAATAAEAMSVERHAGPEGGRALDSVSGDHAVKLPFAEAQTSGFGWRSDPFGRGRRFHGGVDLGAAYGTEVPAAARGEVIYAGERGSYGNLVIVRHADGVETRYAHLSAVGVTVGDRIDEGQFIGRVGSTGRSTAPHLHFEVRVNGERVDPERIASRLGRGPLKSDVSADD